MRTIISAALAIACAGCAPQLYQVDLDACDNIEASQRAQCIRDADAANQKRLAVASAIAGGAQGYAAAQATQPVYVPAPQPAAWSPTTVTCNTWDTGATKGATEQTTCTAR